MKRAITRIIALASAAAAAVAASTALPAAADPVAEFYKGRTLTVLVGQEPGTGFDIYGRTLARHLGRLIPGNPSVVVQNMPGASGVNSFNWLGNIAPRDGTVMGTSSQNVVVEALFGNTAAKYDVTRFNWIGNMEESAAVCGFTPDAGVAGVDDLLAREVVVGATGPTGPIGQSARALNAIVGTRLKIIYGYKGTASIKQAMQSREVKGICGLPWSTIKSFWKDMLDDGSFRPVIQLSARRQAELGAIAHIDDHVRTDEARQLVELIYGQLVLGRIFAMPPGVPAERVAALRAAFMATTKDAELAADMEKAGFEVSPVSGEDIDALIKRVYAAPKEAIDRARAAVGTAK